LFEEVIILQDGQLLIHEEMAKLLEKAHFLSGKEETIMQLIKSKKIIHKEFFGATAIVGVLDEFSREEINNLKSNNIEVSSMPLQKLFIYLTEEVKG
jgi:ABC-2 type transport system ATP-binding protein